jgi:hypothetical protein
MVDLITNHPVSDSFGVTGASSAAASAGGSNDVVTLPPLTEAQITALQDVLPKLAAPLLYAGSISLEELVKAVGMETRQVNAKTGLETLKVKAEEIETKNEKKLEEVIKRLEEKRKLGPFLSALKWIGLAIAAAVATLATAAAMVGGGPLAAVGAAILVAMVVNTMVSEASGGKASIGVAFAEMAKACGASDEAAQWFGMGMEIGIAVAGAIMTFGAGAAGAGAKVAEKAVQVGEKAAQVAERTMLIMGKLSKITNIIGGVNGVLQGVTVIVDATHKDKLNRSQAAQKELEAILARLAEAQDTETKFLEAVMKRAEELLGKVREIVQANAETQMNILVNAPIVA